MTRLQRSVVRLARPLLPGWPDAGRGIVQGPAIRGFLMEATAGGSPGIVLNAGCGEGLFAPLLLSTGAPQLQIEMDLSRAGARHLRSPCQRYICGSLTRVPLQSASVDLILCSEVLEHVLDDRTAVAEIARVLKPGGWLVISVPTPPAVPDANHVREGYTYDELVQLLNAFALRPRGSRECMHLFFRSVLRWWRPGRVPLAAITAMAWLDRALPIGPPMDLIVLARKYTLRNS